MVRPMRVALHCRRYNRTMAQGCRYAYLGIMARKDATMSQGTDRTFASVPEDSLGGFLYALAAYGLWGFLPLYLKAVSHVPPLEVLAHRVIWALPVALVVLAATGRTSDLARALRTPWMVGMAAVTAALISTNWGIYVWAIGAGRTLDAALGYYINPLFSIFLGAVLLGERPSPAQWVAIGLAAIAVGVLAVDGGGVPVVSLALTVTWGFYAFFKRRLPIGPNQGFALEAMLLMIPALGWFAHVQTTGQGHFAMGSLRDTMLLIGCGVVTAVPLMIYANGAKRLRLSTIAILQYVAPTLIFLIAVFVFDEPFGRARMIAFPLIWAGLIIYTTAMLRGAHKSRAARAMPRAG